MQRVKVPPEELSVRLGSYPGDGMGDLPSKPRGKEPMRDRLASVRAATRVKPEQASKVQMGATSRRPNGEVRRGASEQPTDEAHLLPGVMGAARTHAATCDTGDLPRCPQGNHLVGGGPRQKSEEPIVPMKPGNSGGGKGLWFEVRLDEMRVRRSA